MGRKVILLIFVGLLVLVAGGLVWYFWPLRAKGEPAFFGNASGEVVFSGSVSGLEWRLGEGREEALGKYLDKISFWQEGVIYGFPAVEGEKKISTLEIKLVSDLQNQSKVSNSQGKVFLSSGYAVEGEKMVINVQADTAVSKDTKSISQYIVEQIYKKAVWPRGQYTFGTEDYKKEQSSFATGYVDSVGELVK